MQKQTNIDKNKQTYCRTWWSKFTDEENMPMYTKEWVKFIWGNLVWSKNV